MVSLHVSRSYLQVIYESPHDIIYMQHDHMTISFTCSMTRGKYVCAAAQLLSLPRPSCGKAGYNLKVLKYFIKEAYETLDLLQI